MSRRISTRAQKLWDKLGSWYGARLNEQYGAHPPEDWAELFDRTDPDDMAEAMIVCRRLTPIHPPTLGQLEDSIPTRIEGPAGPSKPERLCFLMLEKYGQDLCKHQLAMPWNYFGPVVTGERILRGLKANEKPPTVTHSDPIGVQVPACAACEKPSFRVRLDQALVAA